MATPRSKCLSPEEALSKAVRSLRRGLAAPNEEVIRGWVLKEIEAAKKEEHWGRLSESHRKALEDIQEAAVIMLGALKGLAFLEPWAHEGETGDLYPMYDLLPVGDLFRFNKDLKALASMGEAFEEDQYKGSRRWVVKNGPFAGHPVRLQLPAKKPTRPRLPDHVLHLHQAARAHLEKVGLSAGILNVARLGDLYCSASGFPLKGDLSTKAARYACIDLERVAYQIGGKTKAITPAIVRGKKTKIRSVEGPLELMWTVCSIMPKPE